MFTKAKADKLFDLNKKGAFDELHPAILKTFDDFNKKIYLNFESSIFNEVDLFLEFFFNIIKNREFVLGSYVEKYLYYITLLENLAHLSSFKTTEVLLNQLIADKSHEVQKILLLMNLKNSIDLGFIDALFLENPALGSYWLYSVYTRHCFFNDTVSVNMIKLQNRLQNYDLYPFDNICSLYFNSTYINPENHINVRKKINTAIGKYMPVMKIKNSPSKNNRPRIGIVSKNWRKDKAVYKCIGAFIESLASDFDLSLIELNTKSQCRFDYFTNTKLVQKSGKFIDLTSIIDNDFNMVIFPDIGLNTESIILSNLRIAPVQVSMYGHPVSTASDMIDFFIVGELSETDELIKNYSENTCIIKGTGMNSVLPALPRPGINDKIKCLKGDIINIFVSSSLPKINSIIKHYWKKIIDESEKPVVLHFLPGDCGFQEISVLRKDMQDFIGKDSILIHPQKQHNIYMDIIKHCDFAIGSYHYGDYNRVVDALWMGTPIIVVKGECGYQNTGVAALKALGIEELIAENLDEYVSLALTLISDDNKRKNLQKKVLYSDIQNQLIQNSEYIDDFKSKIKLLIEE